MRAYPYPYDVSSNDDSYALNQVSNHVDERGTDVDVLCISSPPPLSPWLPLAPHLLPSSVAPVTVPVTTPTTVTVPVTTPTTVTVPVTTPTTVTVPQNHAHTER